MPYEVIIEIRIKNNRLAEIATIAASLNAAGAIINKTAKPLEFGLERRFDWSPQSLISAALAGNRAPLIFGKMLAEWQGHIITQGLHL